jgi:hypothetical protein
MSRASWKRRCGVLRRFERGQVRKDELGEAWRAALRGAAFRA